MCKSSFRYLRIFIESSNYKKFQEFVWLFKGKELGGNTRRA